MDVASYHIWHIYVGTNKTNVDQLAAAQTKMERIVLNITRRGRKASIWIRERISVTDIINNAIYRKLFWTGHFSSFQDGRWTARINSCSGQDTSAASKTADGQHVSTVVQDRTRQPLPRRPMDSTYQQMDVVRDEKITNKERRDGLSLERRHLADVGQDR